MARVCNFHSPVLLLSTPEPSQAWQDPETLIGWIAIGFLMVMSLAVLFLWLSRLYIKKVLQTKEAAHQMAILRQEELLRATVTAQERERARIAADLHDELMSKLNVLALLSHTNDESRNRLQIIKESIATTRRISHDLAPPMIEQSSLRTLITEHADQLSTHYAVDMYFNAWHEPIYTPELKIQVLRILQEAFNNIIKHAAASKINLHCRFSTHALVLKVADNGKGLPAGQAAKGLGLSNIASRIQLLKGSFKLKDLPTGGACLLVHVPLNPS